MPTGTPLKAIIKAAGGATGKLKAILVGGPSGGFLPAKAIDTAYGGWRSTRLAPSSGRAASWSWTRAPASSSWQRSERFMSDESCGKCIPCCIGTRRLVELGDRFTGGRPRPNDVQLLSDLSADIRDGSLCGHGITAPIR